MKIKKITLSILSILIYSNIYGQDNTVASGGQGNGSGGKISYSVGQVNFISLEGAGGSINQGVQQPYEFYGINTNSLEEINIYGKIYPVPTSSDVTLKLENMDLSDLSYSLFAADGKNLTQDKILTSSTSIPMEYLPPGIYFLQVKNKTTQLKEFKIIKN